MDFSADTASANTAEDPPMPWPASRRRWTGWASPRAATRASAQLAENARLRKAMGEALGDLDGLIARVEGLLPGRPPRRIRLGRVTLMIGGRDYAVACAEGEEAHVAGLGQMIDAKLAELPSATAQSEVRSLLFAALLLADEVSELRHALPDPASPRRSRTRPDPARPVPPASTPLPKGWNSSPTRWPRPIERIVGEGA
jgi:cell division protein ZapA